MAILEIKKVVILLLVILIIGCSNQNTIQPVKEKVIVGGDLDAHGCKASAGYSWCEARQTCLRSWEDSCELILDDSNFSNIKVVKDDSSPMYLASKGNYEYPLRYTLEQLNQVKLEENLIFLIKEKIYLTKDPELVTKTQGDSTIASMEVGDVLAKSYKKEVQAALTKKVDNVIPQITCSNASDQTTVIYLILGKENKVYKSYSCIIIEGVDGKGLIMSSEKLAYYFLSKL